MTQAKKIICSQCGAVIPPGEAECPYCGSAYAPEAERAYMRKLHQVRRDLDKVGNTGAVESRREIGRLRRRIVRILAVILVIYGVLYGLFRYMEQKESRENRREYLWQQEEIPKLNAMFEAGEYDDLIDAFRRAGDEGHSLYEWEHYDFCVLYESTKYMDETLRAREKGLFTDSDAIALLYDELCFRGAGYKTRIPAEDRKLIQELYDPYRNDLVDIFHMTEEELESFDQMLKKYGGYPEYKACEEYVAGHPEILFGDKP